MYVLYVCLFKYFLSKESSLESRYELLPPMTMTKLCKYLTRIPLVGVSKKKLKEFKYFVEGKVDSFNVWVRKDFTYIYGNV